jgi:hypothetical protein
MSIITRAEKRKLKFWPPNCFLLFLALILLPVQHITAQNIPYAKLDDCQRARFDSYHNSTPTVGLQTWLSLEDSQRVEYAGGTHALTTMHMPPPPCWGLNPLPSLNAIWGSRPDHPSAEQFHIEVNWSPKADDAFKSLNGWGLHIAWLHSGQYGFQENRNGNPFLGLVVLFEEKNPQAGQFHIDFRSWFAHFFPNNGNIAKNYKRYCRWYGRIDGYPETCQSSGQEFDWRTARLSDSAKSSDTFPSSNLRETVRDFLSEWYVRQNLDGLDRFIAKDNAAYALAERGILPDGVVRSHWATLFSQAFEEGPGADRVPELPNAITYQEPSLPKFVPPLKYENENPAADHFAILAPDSTAETALLPSERVNSDQMDPAAQFLRHLKLTYRTKDLEHNKLFIVVYATAGTGLLKEGVVQYWIQESGTWKLAAFQGTD